MEDQRLKERQKSPRFSKESNLPRGVSFTYDPAVAVEISDSVVVGP